MLRRPCVHVDFVIVCKGFLRTIGRFLSDNKSFRENTMMFENETTGFCSDSLPGSSGGHAPIHSLTNQVKGATSQHCAAAAHCFNSSAHFDRIGRKRKALE
jgi:hypothetical protein